VGEGRVEGGDHRRGGKGQEGDVEWQPWGVGREPRGADWVSERSCLWRRGGGRSEKREGGKGIRHVDGSDGDKGNVGGYFIRGADGRWVILVEVFDEQVGIDVC
jgi:hypothetical protein